jgi:hypothetical protein
MRTFAGIPETIIERAVEKARYFGWEIEWLKMAEVLNAAVEAGLSFRHDDPASYQTDPKWAAQIRSDQEREALLWLEGQIGAESIAVGSTLVLAHLRTLQAMVVRTGWPDRMMPGPVLPEVPSPDVLLSIGHEMAKSAFWDTASAARTFYRALYAHLTGPNTATVYTVGYATDEGSAGGATCGMTSLDAAIDIARDHAAKGHTVTIRSREITLGASAGPKTKTVEVWRVEYSTQRADGAWNSSCSQFNEKFDADREADFQGRHCGARCIKVTGPHQQEVPAT